MISIEKKQEYTTNFLNKHPNYFVDYREKNRDKLICNSREYYQTNKNKFYVTVKCELCGKEMLKANLKRHQKTKLCAKSALKALHQENPNENEEVVELVVD